jgi:hypothetical protein
MTTRPPLQWQRILLTAFLAAILSMTIVYLAVTIIAALGIDIVTPLCDCEINDLGSLIGCMLACFVVLAILFGLLYFAIAILLSAVLINVWVGQRRLAHTVISVLISVPIAILVGWLIDLIF